MDFDEAVLGSKKRENYIYHVIQNRRFGGFFPSLTFQNPEEGGNKAPKRRH